MSTSAILPTSAAIGATFAATFTDVALATEALPYEIPGVAKFGYLPPAEHATEQLPPLLVLDGSPRPDVMPDFRDAAMLHDILDTKWSALTRGVDVDKIEVEGITPRDVRLFSIMLKDNTPRELIAEHDGSWLLNGFAQIMMQGAGQLRGERLKSLFFVAGALEACARMFSPNAKDRMMEGIKIFRAGKRIEELMEEIKMGAIPSTPELNYDHEGAGAIVGEAYADAVRRNKGPVDLQNFLRHEAARGWATFLVHKSGEYPDKVKMVLNRAFNGAQVDPGGLVLETLFQFNMKDDSFEERVKNIIRVAWIGLIQLCNIYPDKEGLLSCSAWEVISGEMTALGNLLSRDNPDFPKAEFDESFPGLDEDELTKKVTALAAESTEIAWAKIEETQDGWEYEPEEEDDLEN